MRINRFSHITCSILLLACMAFSIHAADHPERKAGRTQQSIANAPSPQAPREDYQRILEERNQFKQKIDDLNLKITQLEADKERLQRENQQLREIRSSSFPKNVLTIDYFDKRYQPPKDPKEPDMKGMIIAISCVGGVIFLLLIISTMLLLFVIKRTNGKSLKKEDIQKLLSESFSSFSRDYQKSVQQILEKLPSEVAISSSVQENLKGRFEDLRKALNNQAGAKSESEILTIVKAIQSAITGELASLRSQAQSVSSQKAELSQKIAEADRKAAQAKKTIDDFEKEKARAVDAVKTDMQVTMQKQLMAERAKASEALQQQSAAVEEQRKKIEQLTKECADWKSQAASAESAGYQRGLSGSQEKMDSLVRENEKLSIALQQEREKNQDSEREFQQKLSSAISEKEKEFEHAQLQSQNTIRENLEKEYKGEIERLSIALTEKATEVANATQQKNESASQVRELQKQILQVQNDLGVAQKKAQDAETRVRAAEEEKGKLKASISDITKEKDLLDRKIADCNSTIKQLTQEKASIANSLQGAERKIADLQTAIYPSEFIKDEGFSVLKDHLDSWVSERIGAAETIKSSLGLFSQRSSLNEETWFQALRNISVGITQTLRTKKLSQDEILKELVLWSKYLMKFSDENFDFSLKIPNIGDVVDPSWMTAKSSRNTKVAAVLSWAVWHNQYGVRHNAEVE